MITYHKFIELKIVLKKFDNGVLGSMQLWIYGSLI
jgi:hypothetical protein